MQLDLSALTNVVDGVVVTSAILVVGSILMIPRLALMAVRWVKGEVGGGADSSERGIWYDAEGTPRYVDGNMDIATGAARRFKDDYS